MSDERTFGDDYAQLQIRLARLAKDLKLHIGELQADYIKQCNKEYEALYQQYPDMRPSPVIGEMSFVEHMQRIVPDDGTGQPSTGPDTLTCVLCGEKAVVKSGDTLVCEQHFQEYQEEERQYLLEHVRRVWLRI